MEISEYRNRSRRPIALPSGLRGFVRPPSVMDLAAYPALLGVTMNGGADASRRAEATRDWVRCALRRCFIPERGAMCEKEPGECLPGELSVYELAPADADAILEAVAALSAPSPRKEGPAEGSFPGGPGAGGVPGDAPPPGEDLRPAPPPSG